MKTAPKTRTGNVMSFILEGCWPLDAFDQRELRRLSKIAKRNCVGVADVIYEAVESFVAKCEAEADLEENVITFPTVGNKWRSIGSLTRVRQTQSAFHPLAQRNAFLLLVCPRRDDPERLAPLLRVERTRNDDAETI